MQVHKKIGPGDQDFLFRCVGDVFRAAPLETFLVFLPVKS